MVGQVVMLRMESQYTLAVISVSHSPDDADLLGFAMYSNGKIGPVEIPHAIRGDGIDQWRPCPWPDSVLLTEVQGDLMPAEALAEKTPKTVMVIIRH